jgi:hypothetical protein
VVQTAADGRNCTAACLDRNETPFASSGVHFIFFLPVRALRFTYTDHTPMQFAPGIRLRPVCPPTTTVPVWKTKGLVRSGWPPFSRSHTSAQWVSLMTACKKLLLPWALILLPRWASDRMRAAWPGPSTRQPSGPRVCVVNTSVAC